MIQPTRVLMVFSFSTKNSGGKKIYNTLFIKFLDERYDYIYYNGNIYPLLPNCVNIFILQIEDISFLHSTFFNLWQTALQKKD